MKLDSYIGQSGISITRLADELGVSHEYARLLVRGRRRPSLAVLVKISRLTGGAVTANDFFDIPTQAAE